MNNEENKNKKVSEAFLKGAQDATQVTKRYSPKVKTEVDSVLRELAYVTGYIPGLINGLLNEFITDDVRSSLKKGVCKGADKAKEAATKLRDKRDSPPKA